MPLLGLSHEIIPSSVKDVKKNLLIMLLPLQENILKIVYVCGGMAIYENRPENCAWQWSLEFLRPDCIGNGSSS